MGDERYDAMVNEVHSKLVAIRAESLVERDNPRLIALTEQLIRLTEDPKNPDADTTKQLPASNLTEMGSGPVVVAGISSDQVRGYYSDKTASTKTPAPVTTGNCTHPKVIDGVCTWCGDAIKTDQ